jgi:phosphoribosylaminoimidazolecarboxamide formyltransferase/IMP cyclohydrolase
MNGGGHMSKIERAIISVTDKTGVVDFARSLAGFGVQILSTGGTAKAMRDGGVTVTDISEYTGFPEMLDGRVKTLHPKVHGGLLGMRSNQEHVKTMKKHGIKNIDMVVVNLYQFEKTVAKQGVTLDEAIENIDIGGPAMLRSSAKNFRDVTVIVDPSDYDKVLKEMKENGGATLLKTRFRLAKKVFKLTHNYDGAISRYLEGVEV